MVEVVLASIEIMLIFATVVTTVTKEDVNDKLKVLM